MLQFNFLSTNEIVEDLPKADNNPNLLTLSDDDIAVFNLIENVPITETASAPSIPTNDNDDVVLKPEPPDITEDIKSEGIQSRPIYLLTFIFL